MAKSTPLIVNFDMDGVLADFDGAVFDYYGEGYKELSSEKVSDFWNNDVFANETFLRAEIIEVGMALLIDVASIKNVDLRILTSTGGGKHHIEIIRQKTLWLVQHLPDFVKPALIAVPGSAKKAAYAQPGHILIDDWVNNVDDWTNAGGVGLLFERNVSYCSELKKNLVKRANR